MLQIATSCLVYGGPGPMLSWKVSVLPEVGASKGTGTKFLTNTHLSEMCHCISKCSF